jgi:ribokinase
MTSLNVNWQQARYRALIGTGGIGSGLFFAMTGSHTLGREESRAVRFLPRRDYCKLHIISHYIKVLLGADFPALLIGKVGEDAIGHNLLEEMRQTGLDTRYVQVAPGETTMLSVVFNYPDGSGGNLTPENSACDQVDSAFIRQAAGEFPQWRGKGIALAAPEVPLAARKTLLTLAIKNAFFRVGSFVSGEVRAALELGLFDLLDLVALNIDEAAAVLGISGDEGALSFEKAEAIAQAAAEHLHTRFPHLWLSLTAGKHGSWCWDGQTLAHQPAFPTRLVATAGAGDAHIAGITSGLAAGLSLVRAQELGSLVAALSVTSPDTIAPEVGREGLAKFVEEWGIGLSEEVQGLIG